MNSHWAKKSRVAFALATVAHVLGWAAFLWIVLPPTLYQEASFSEFNGYWSVLAFFVPVVVTGLALMFLLTRRVRRSGECAGSLGPLGCPASVLRLGLFVVRHIVPAGGHSFDSNRRCLWAWARIALVRRFRYSARQSGRDYVASSSGLSLLSRAWTSSRFSAISSVGKTFS